MSDTSPRFGLPLLQAGQAQKEIVHNEALIALETLVQPVVETIGSNTPPAAPVDGMSWIVGPSPSDAWVGQAAAIASWTAGGWRFTAPVAGMWLWVAGEGLWARRTGSAWELGRIPAAALMVGGQQVVGARQPGVTVTPGGGVVDAEARAAISGIIAALRNHGLIAS